MNKRLSAAIAGAFLLQCAAFAEPANTQKTMDVTAAQGSDTVSTSVGETKKAKKSRKKGKQFISSAFKNVSAITDGDSKHIADDKQIAGAETFAGAY